eukprot:4518766-Pyramimonas_sp.AAC.1
MPDVVDRSYFDSEDMRQGSLIMLRETHGGRLQIEVLTASSLFPYRARHSYASQAWAGGVAFRLPWVRDVPPAPRPPVQLH